MVSVIVNPGPTVPTRPPEEVVEVVVVEVVEVVEVSNQVAMKRLRIRFDVDWLIDAVNSEPRLIV